MSEERFLAGTMLNVLVFRPRNGIVVDNRSFILVIEIRMELFGIS
jgi:hypothetical protein